MYKKILIAILLLIMSQVSNAKSCTKYKSCSELILDYPNGNFAGKDRDKDGIPCENICTSKEEIADLLKKVQLLKKNN